MSLCVQKSYIKSLQTGGMSQAVEHLPSKCETLSSNLSITKKRPENLNSIVRYNQIATLN
jgi:hypothetical protein